MFTEPKTTFGNVIMETPKKPKTTPTTLLRVKCSFSNILDANPVRMGINPTTIIAETSGPAYSTPVYCNKK